MATIIRVQEHGLGERFGAGFERGVAQGVQHGLDKNAQADATAAAAEAKRKALFQDAVELSTIQGALQNQNGEPAAESLPRFGNDSDGEQATRAKVLEESLLSVDGAFSQEEAHTMAQSISGMDANTLDSFTTIMGGGKTGDIKAALTRYAQIQRDRGALPEDVTDDKILEMASIYASFRPDSMTDESRKDFIGMLSEGSSEVIAGLGGLSTGLDAYRTSGSDPVARKKAETQIIASLNELKEQKGFSTLMANYDERTKSIINDVMGGEPLVPDRVSKIFDEVRAAYLDGRIVDARTLLAEVEEEGFSQEAIALRGETEPAAMELIAKDEDGRRSQERLLLARQNTIMAEARSLREEASLQLRRGQFDLARDTSKRATRAEARLAASARLSNQLTELNIGIKASTLLDTQLGGKANVYRNLVTGEFIGHGHAIRPNELRTLAKGVIAVTDTQYAQIAGGRMTFFVPEGTDVSKPIPPAELKFAPKGAVNSTHPLHSDVEGWVPLDVEDLRSRAGVRGRTTVTQDETNRLHDSYRLETTRDAKGSGAQVTKFQALARTFAPLRDRGDANSIDKIADDRISLRNLLPAVFQNPEANQTIDSLRTRYKDVGIATVKALGQASRERLSDADHPGIDQITGALDRVFGKRIRMVINNQIDLQDETAVMDVLSTDRNLVTEVLAELDMLDRVSGTPSFVTEPDVPQPDPGAAELPPVPNPQGGTPGAAGGTQLNNADVSVTRMTPQVAEGIQLTIRGVLETNNIRSISKADLIDILLADPKIRGRQEAQVLAEDYLELHPDPQVQLELSR